jgi:hypothetical protein
MTPARYIQLAVAIASILAAAPAQTQTSHPDTVVYGLSRESQFEWGCFAPCVCPVFTRQPVDGTFKLTKTGSDPLFDYYSVTEVKWKAAGATTPTLIEGSGTYRRGGEAALQEQLTLDLSFDGGRAQRFDSGLRPPQAPFPEIHTTISLHGEYCLDSAIVVIARPIGVASVDRGVVPEVLTAVPNPFQASTVVAFSLSRRDRIDLDVVDLAGREVCSLGHGEWLAAGRHSRSWDGRLTGGGAAPPGLYFIRIRTIDGVHARGVVKLE